MLASSQIRQISFVIMAIVYGNYVYYIIKYSIPLALIRLAHLTETVTTVI
jgi:hypothetical protein